MEYFVTMSETVNTSSEVRYCKRGNHTIEEPILCRRGRETEIRGGSTLLQVIETVGEETEEGDVLDKVKSKEVHRRGVDDCSELAMSKLS